MASYDIEKDQTKVDDRERSVSPDLNDDRINHFTPAQQKKIIGRIDRRLVLTLGFLYSVSLMDRNNLGIAFVAVMGVDLLLTGSRYSIIVLIFFITYVALQASATVFLRKVGPRIFLPTIALLWGATMIGFGFVKSWTQLIPLRLVLGIFEAGFAPGCAYLLSCWYPRYDLQKRYAVFYMIGVVGSAFSGILAYGFSRLNGLGFGAGLGQHYGLTKADLTAPSGEESGIAGWRWIL
jgi:MFS family permease